MERRNTRENNELLTKYHEGTLSKREGALLYEVVDRFITSYECKRFGRRAWDSVHLERISLFYQFLELHKGKKLGYVITVWRCLASNIETYLHLCSRGVRFDEGVAVINTRAMLWLTISEMWNAKHYERTGSKQTVTLREFWTNEVKRIGIRSSGDVAYANFLRVHTKHQHMLSFLPRWYLAHQESTSRPDITVTGGKEWLRESTRSLLWDNLQEEDSVWDKLYSFGSQVEKVAG